jgi:hypothetical protein
MNIYFPVCFLQVQRGAQLFFNDGIQTKQSVYLPEKRVMKIALVFFMLFNIGLITAQQLAFPGAEGLENMLPGAVS